MFIPDSNLDALISDGPRNSCLNIFGPIYVLLREREDPELLKKGALLPLLVDLIHLLISVSVAASGAFSGFLFGILVTRAPYPCSIFIGLATRPLYTAITTFFRFRKSIS